MCKRIFPDVVKHPITHSLPPEATVRDAAMVMHSQSVGVVLVMEGQNLCGIFSERDIAGRVIAAGLSPDKTQLRDVMTSDVITIRPNSSADEALALMRAYHCRHLPVMEDDRVLAMVSLRDLHRAIRSQLQDDLQQCRSYIYGSY
jgi:CBS domain-containing protein